MYRLMTLPLAGAAGLEPCAVERAVEVAIVLMCRYCLICIRLGVETKNVAVCLLRSDRVLAGLSS
jgi:hypothetical protein